MASQGAALQNHNNELVKCTFGAKRKYCSRATLTLGRASHGPFPLQFLSSLSSLFFSSFRPPTGEFPPFLRGDELGLRASSPEAKRRVRCMPESRTREHFTRREGRARRADDTIITCAYTLSWHCGGWGWVRTPEVVEGEPLVPPCLLSRKSEESENKLKLNLPCPPQNCLSSSCAGIEDLRDKREEINKQICKEEDEKAKVQNDLTVLSKRLTTLNDSIARKVRIP